MGDVPLAYVETVGGVRVSEDDVVIIEKNDVCELPVSFIAYLNRARYCLSKLDDHDINGLPASFDRNCAFFKSFFVRLGQLFDMHGNLCPLLKDMSC
jgi:hypothetical protein